MPVIDILIVYFIRQFPRVLQYLRSMRWEQRKAQIQDVQLLKSFFMGCHVIQVQFIDGSHVGIEKIPVLFEESIRLKWFANVGMVVIRKYPTNAKEMFLFQWDQ